MKKLLTVILTLSFVLTIVGGAFAETTPTIDSGGTQTTTTTTITTPETIETAPIVTPEIVDVNILTGALKSINYVEKKFTIAYSKTSTKEFTYVDNNFELNGKTITPESIPLDSKLTVKYLIYSDKSEKIVKVQVANLEVKAYPGTVSAFTTDGTIKVTFANKKYSKEFKYDGDTKFEYKGKAINPSLIVIGSKVVVKYQVLADKSLKVVKVQVVQLAKKAKPVKAVKPVKSVKKVKSVKTVKTVKTVKKAKR